MCHIVIPKFSFQNSFIFGCAGSSPMCGPFSLVVASGGRPPLVVCGLLVAAAAHAAEPGTSRVGDRARVSCTDGQVLHR